MQRLDRFGQKPKNICTRIACCVCFDWDFATEICFLSALVHIKHRLQSVESRTQTGPQLFAYIKIGPPF